MKRTFSVAWMGLWLLLSGALMAAGHAASPSDYRITALAVDPRHPDTVYAGTPSGLFKTTDGGGHWERIRGSSVNAIAMDLLSSEVIYIGTDGGVFRSEDGGQSWSSASEGLGSTTILEVAVDPTRSGVVYAGTGAGVFRSSDGGKSWSAVNQGLSGPPTIWDLAVNPLSPDTLFAATSAGVFRTNNGGGTWVAVSGHGLVGSAYARYQAVAIHPAQPSTLYLGASALGSAWLFRSTDGGATWKALQSGLPSSPNRPSLVLDPSDLLRAYVGHDTEGVFRTMDGGETWKPIREGMLFRSVSALAIDSVRPTTLYAGTNGAGVYKSTDRGTTWRQVNTGLVNVVILSVWVTDPQGKGVANASVNVWDPISGQSGWGPTSSDGSYRVALTPGTYTVNVQPPWGSEWPSKTVEGVQITEDTTLDIVLEAGVILSGRVTDPEGNPVAKAFIQARDPMSGQSGRGPTSSDGSYRVALTPGTYTVNVQPPWGSEWPSKTVEGVQITEDTTLDIVLEAGVILSGRVTDPEGNPVAGAFINVWDRKTGRSGWGQTSSDGSYRVALAPGTYTLQIQPPQGSEWPSKAVEGVPITEDTTLDIVLEAGVILSMRVTDPEGNPVAGASINVRNPVSGQEGWGQTSSDGSYRVALTPGTYTVNTQPPEGSGLAGRIEGVEVTEDTSLDIVLEPGFLLSGRVTDREGKGIFPVFIVAQEPGMAWGEYIHLAVAEGNADGSYRMRLMGGTYDLLVLELAEDKFSVVVGRKVVNVEVNADRTLDIVLPSPESAFTLSGTVTDSEGRRRAELWIEAYDPATGNYALAITQGDGTYSMKLPPGTYDLTVTPPSGSGLPKGEIKGVQITGDTVRHIIVGPEIITFIEEENTDVLPRTFALFQSYPNPFNAVMVIPYALPTTCAVRISIYNLLGQEIRTLVDEVQPAGTYRVVWDGKDAGGRLVSSGTYLYRLEAGAFTRTRKALFMR